MARRRCGGSGSGAAASARRSVSMTAGRVRAAASLATLALAAAFTGGAAAQVDAQRFKPPVTHDGWVNAEGSAVRHPDDRWSLAAWANYGHQPLITSDADGNVVRS